jgi:Mg/Co/Ni transporter MgtE
MLPPIRQRLASLLDYPADRAGGFMTPLLVTASEQDTVGDVRARLADQAEHRSEIDAVAVCDPRRRVLADVPLLIYSSRPMNSA